MEHIFNGVIGLFLIFYLYISLMLDKNTIAGDVFGAGGFPIVLAVLGLGILAGLVRSSLKGKTKVHIPLFDIKSASGKLVILNVVMLAVYVFAMNIIGFLLSTLLFAFGSARAMGYKKLNIIVLFSVLLSFVLVIVFGRVFFIPLPRGIGIFRELSYLIY
jgi:hypothetical protein